MPVKIFCCYAHEDERLLKKLKAHLRPLQQQGFIDIWHDRDISAGIEWEREISVQINTAQIILLLISPDFMNSDYCYSIEMKRALERHEQGNARVIPVILRPVYWQAVLGHVQALPKDGEPVSSRHWHNRDEALLDVVKGIHKVIDGFLTRETTEASANQTQLVINHPDKNEIYIDEDGNATLPSAEVLVLTSSSSLNDSQVKATMEAEKVTRDYEIESEITLQQAQERWEAVKKRVKHKNVQTAALLSYYRVVDIEIEAEETVVFIEAATEVFYNHLSQGERVKHVDWGLAMEFQRKCRTYLLHPGEKILNLELLKASWETIKQRVKQKNRQTAALLSYFTVVGVERAEGETIVMIEAVSELFYNHLNQGERVRHVEWGLSMEFQQKCRVRLLHPGESSIDLS